tara:strand:+ start:983 stop:1090 length:108 start_codon:yes stop_codon:yes gene_type:complete
VVDVEIDLIRRKRISSDRVSIYFELLEHLIGNLNH